MIKTTYIIVSLALGYLFIYFNDVAGAACRYIFYCGYMLD